MKKHIIVDIRRYVPFHNREYQRTPIWARLSQFHFLPSTFSVPSCYPRMIHHHLQFHLALRTLSRHKMLVHASLPTWYRRTSSRRVLHICKARPSSSHAFDILFLIAYCRPLLTVFEVSSLSFNSKLVPLCACASIVKVLLFSCDWCVICRLHSTILVTLYSISYFSSLTSSVAFLSFNYSNSLTWLFISCITELFSRLMFLYLLLLVLNI